MGKTIVVRKQGVVTKHSLAIMQHNVPRAPHPYAHSSYVAKTMQHSNIAHTVAVEQLVAAEQQLPAPIVAAQQVVHHAIPAKKLHYHVVSRCFAATFTGGKANKSRKGTGCLYAIFDSYRKADAYQYATRSYAVTCIIAV